MTRGTPDWEGNVYYSDADRAAICDKEADQYEIRRMKRRIADLELRLAAVEKLVGASPVESALVTSYPRTSSIAPVCESSTMRLGAK